MEVNFMDGTFSYSSGCLPFNGEQARFIGYASTIDWSSTDPGRARANLTDTMFRFDLSAFKYYFQGYNVHFTNGIVTDSVIDLGVLGLGVILEPYSYQNLPFKVIKAYSNSSVGLLDDPQATQIKLAFAPFAPKASASATITPSFTPTTSISSTTSPTPEESRSAYPSLCPSSSSQPSATPLTPTPSLTPKSTSMRTSTPTSTPPESKWNSELKLLFAFAATASWLFGIILGFILGVVGHIYYQKKFGGFSVPSSSSASSIAFEAIENHQL